MITYNHEDYIKEAIDSILIQEGEFDLELIIVNDFSLDKTEEIIKELIYNNTSSVKINYFSNESNKGIVESLLISLKKCKGEFIAICEGDDFWNSKNKIDKQLRLIKSDPNLSMIVHKSTMISDYLRLKNNVLPNYKIEKNNIYFNDIVNLIKSKPCHTSSYFFYKNKLNLDDLSYCIVGEEFGDTPLFALIATKGDIKIIDEELSTYRLHKNGFSNAKTNDKIRIGNSYISIFTKMKKIISVSYHNTIDIAIKTEYYKLANLYSLLGDRKLAKRYFKMSFFENRYFFFKNFKSYIFLVLYCYLNESLYKWCLEKYRYIKQITL